MQDMTCNSFSIQSAKSIVLCLDYTVHSVSTDHCFILNWVFIIVFISHPIRSFLIVLNYRLYRFRVFFKNNFLSHISADFFFIKVLIYIFIVIFGWGIFLYCFANKMCVAVIYCYMLNAFYMESTL